jgi:hypothetical protein
MTTRPAYMQVSVALPPLLMEGLLENYTGVTGKKATFAGVALYALNELYCDLNDPNNLAEAGITLPEHNPTYTVSIPKSERRADNGFYSMKVPDHFQEKWWKLLKAHGDNGPSTVYRALLSLYRSVRYYYAENESNAAFLVKYPDL